MNKEQEAEQILSQEKYKWLNALMLSNGDEKLLREAIIEALDMSELERISAEVALNMVIEERNELHKKVEVMGLTDPRWKQLRDKFFKECVDIEQFDQRGGLAEKYVINIAPHDLFEWFKRELFHVASDSGRAKSTSDILNDILAKGASLEPFVITEEQKQWLHERMEQFDIEDRRRAAQAFIDLSNIIITI